jgi:hypothetical protein
MTIRLEAPLIRALKLYAECIHSSQEWVGNESLRLTFTEPMSDPDKPSPLTSTRRAIHSPQDGVRSLTT